MDRQLNSGVEIISRNLLFRRLTLTTTLNLYNSHLKAWSADYPLHDSFYDVHGDKQNRLMWDVRCMASVRLPWDMTFQAEKSIIRKDKKEGGSLYENCRHKLKHRARPVGGKHIYHFLYHFPYHYLVHSPTFWGIVPHYFPKFHNPNLWCKIDNYL